MAASWACVLARWLLGTVFVAASIGKIRDACHFVSAVAAYRLLPRGLVRPFAYALPRVEAPLGLLLLLGWKTHVVGMLSGLLFVSFSVAMGINLARGRTDLDCGCFGRGRRQRIGGQALARDALLIVLSLQVSLWGGGRFALDGLSPEQQASAAALILPLTLAGCGIYMLIRLATQFIELVAAVPMRGSDERAMVAQLCGPVVTDADGGSGYPGAGA